VGGRVPVAQQEQVFAQLLQRQAGGLQGSTKAFTTRYNKDVHCKKTYSCDAGGLKGRKKPQTKRNIDNKLDTVLLSLKFATTPVQPYVKVPDARLVDRNRGVTVSKPACVELFYAFSH
jgi:hypothetical protein